MRPLWTGAISFGLVNVPVSLTALKRSLKAKEGGRHAEKARRRA